MKKNLVIIGIVFIIMLITIYFSQIIILLLKNNNRSSHTTWNENGIPICVKPEFQAHPRICTDGESGVIITWHDARNGYGTDDIYAQRVDSNGKIMWKLDGIIVCSANGMQRNPTMISDGEGGAIITWNDYRNGEDNIEIYAQKINSEGVIQWPNSGISICNASGVQRYPQICSDDSGGAIITWQDYRGSNSDIYAQRVDSNGNMLWMLNGIAICTEVNSQRAPQICSDGVGGAIITWQDYRGSNSDIYAQRVDSNGIIKWIANGTPICTEINGQILPQLCIDDSGGAIITWIDQRVEPLNYIYTQRIDNNGSIMWTPNGTHIYSCQYSLLDPPKICSDGDGGAFITWPDVNQIFVQRISSTGMKLWLENCTMDDYVSEPRIYSDRDGGAVITFIHSPWNIYAQHIDSNGTFLWIDPALPICTAEYRQDNPDTYCDGKGNVFFVWEDNRVNIHDNYDIYAQYVLYTDKSNLS